MKAPLATTHNMLLALNVVVLFASIELYSVLVGGIPSKPDEAMAKDDLEAALKSEDSQVDWQMTLVSAFFDSCIPNQPGCE